MSTVFSGGTYVNTTFTGDTKANIISNIQTQLTNAGWTVVSGGGTTNLLMQTALGADGYNQGRVRFKDNSGSCVQVTLENVSGTKTQTLNTTTGGNLLPAAAKTFRILASKYRFECFTPGTSLAREVVYAGILAIPTPYVGVITEAIYMGSNAANDSDTTNRGSFRNALGVSGGNCCGIYNGSLMENNNIGNGYCGLLQIRVSACAYFTNYSGSQALAGSQNLYRWSPDNAIDMCDVLMGWGAVSDGSSSEAFLRGQVYDWTLVADSFAADTTDTWTDGGGSHNWIALTGSNIGAASLYPRATIWVAYS